MTKSLTRLALATLGGGLLAAAPAAAGPYEARGESELAEMLGGRVAGEPDRCVFLRSASGLQVIDGTALVFRDGKTLYVNRPEGARLLDQFDLPVFEKRGGSQLCKLDRVELRSSDGRLPGPVLFLADFVPYTRTAVAAR